MNVSIEATTQGEIGFELIYKATELVIPNVNTGLAVIWNSTQEPPADDEETPDNLDEFPYRSTVHWSFIKANSIADEVTASGKERRALTTALLDAIEEEVDVEILREIVRLQLSVRIETPNYRQICVYVRPTGEDVNSADLDYIGDLHVSLP